MRIRKKNVSFKSLKYHTANTKLCFDVSFNQVSTCRKATNKMYPLLFACHVVFACETYIKRCLLNLIPRLSASADKNNGGQILAAKQSYNGGSGKYLHSFQSN